MGIRRRAELAPTDPLEDLESNNPSINELDYVSTEVFSKTGFDHYVSPCTFQVSNDPLYDPDAEANEEFCDATIYGCVQDHKFLIATDEKVRTVNLEYDYDIYYQFDSSMHDFQSVLEFLEGSMLEHLASLLEIKQCPPDTLGGRGAGLERRKLSAIEHGRKLVEFTEEQKSLFVAINSNPIDQLSSFGCVAPGEGGTECQSVVGSMKIYLESNRVSDEDVIAVSNAVLMALKGGMQSNVYTKGVIKDLVFHGNRSPPLPPTQAPTLETTDVPTSAPTTAATDAPSLELTFNGNGEANLIQDEATKSFDSGLGNTAVGLISAGTTFGFFLAMLVLCLCCRREKVDTTASQSSLKEILQDDDEEDQGTRLSSRSGGLQSQNFVAPIVAPTNSLEGAPPGSLAAMDELALKPQFKRDEIDDNSGPVSGKETIPLSPPDVTRTAKTPSPPAIEMSLERAKPAARSVDSSPPSIPTLSPIPLSPVRNKRSGESPSRVSPKRLLYNGLYAPSHNDNAVL